MSGDDNIDLILSSEVVLNQPEQHQQVQRREVVKKKKSRGNRKLQRFRAKLRRQGLHDQVK